MIFQHCFVSFIQFLETSSDWVFSEFSCAFIVFKYHSWRNRWIALVHINSINISVILLKTHIMRTKIRFLHKNRLKQINILFSIIINFLNAPFYSVSSYTQNYVGYNKFTEVCFTVTCRREIYLSYRNFSLCRISLFFTYDETFMYSSWSVRLSTNTLHTLFYKYKSHLNGFTFPKDYFYQVVPSTRSKFRPKVSRFGLSEQALYTGTL